LLSGVTPLTAAAAGPEAMAEELFALVGAVGAAGIDPSGVVFVCSARECQMVKTKVGPKFDSLVLPSLGLPDKTVVAVAAGALASGYRDAPSVETSREALIHFEDSAPAAIIDPAGKLATPTRSAFQTDCVALRVRAKLAWAVAPGGAQVITGVNWYEGFA
jgi:hypothetical protein